MDALLWFALAICIMAFVGVGIFLFHIPTKPEDYSFINEEFLFNVMKRYPPVGVHDVPFRTSGDGIILDIENEGSYRNELDPKLPLKINVRSSNSDRHIYEWTVGLGDPYHEKILDIIYRKDVKSELKFY